MPITEEGTHEHDGTRDFSPARPAAEDYTEAILRDGYDTARVHLAGYKS